MSVDLLNLLDHAFRNLFAAVPAPIAPEAHAHKCLCDDTECCADASCDVPAEAREACK